MGAPNSMQRHSGDPGRSDCCRFPNYQCSNIHRKRNLCSRWEKQSAMRWSPSSRRRSVPDVYLLGSAGHVINEPSPSPSRLVGFKRCHLQFRGLCLRRRTFIRRLNLFHFFLHSVLIGFFCYSRALLFVFQNSNLRFGSEEP